MYAPMEDRRAGLLHQADELPVPHPDLQDRKRSYRELPLRWAELGTVYRYEKSGVLHGLLRVRGFTQDDAHIFCTPEQIEDEVARVCASRWRMLRAFGFEDITPTSARRGPEKAVGEEARWEQATESLEAALKAEGIAYEVDEGGGAFYGPKIDLKIKDAIGREWQMSTIQFDFNLPERFDLTYVGEDGRSTGPTWCTARCWAASSASSAS
jgi:threonyl-tRNA synthetase